MTPPLERRWPEPVHYWCPDCRRYRRPAVAVIRNYHAVNLWPVHITAEIRCPEGHDIGGQLQETVSGTEPVLPPS